MKTRNGSFNQKMSSKILSFISLCVLYLTTSVMSNGHLEEGIILGTGLIHNMTYEKVGKDFKKRSKEIEVKAPNDQRIQAVVVKDLEGDGQSRIKSGGVGKKRVSIKVKSPRGRRLKFSVAVYAF